MKKNVVLLRAPLISQSGYGVHSRQIARWLFELEDKHPNKLEVHTELLNWGQTPWKLDPTDENGLIGRCFQASTKRLEKYDVTIQVQLPNEWCPDLGIFNIGVTAGVEADRVNPAWIEYCNSMNLVIVPSEFSKNAFTKYGNALKTPIEVIPESFIDEILDDTIEPLNLNLSTDFNFLVFGQFTGTNVEDDRKNLPYTLKWLCEEFADNKDVGIVIKTNFGRLNELDRIKTSVSLNQLIREVRKGEYPKVYLLHGDMSNKEIAALYKHDKIKALVTATRGEGFGIPILEAAASGLPVIATDWSAHKEFLKFGKFIPIEAKLGPVHQTRIDNVIFIPGAQWAHPSEEDFKKRVNKFYKSPSVPKEWAKELQIILSKKYSFNSIAVHYNNKLKNILLK